MSAEKVLLKCAPAVLPSKNFIRRGIESAAWTVTSGGVTHFLAVEFYFSGVGENNPLGAFKPIHE